MKTDLLLGAGILYLLLKSKKGKKEFKERKKDDIIKTYKDIALQEVINSPTNQKWLENSLKEAEYTNNMLTMVFSQFTKKLLGGTDKALVSSNSTDTGTENTFNSIKSFITNAVTLDFFKSIFGKSIGEMLTNPYGRLYIGFEDLRKYAAALWFHDNTTVTLSQKFTHVGAVPLTPEIIRKAKFPPNFRIYNVAGRLYRITGNARENNANLPAGDYFLTSIHYFSPGTTIERLVTDLDYFDIKKRISTSLITTEPLAILLSKNFYTTVDP